MTKYVADYSRCNTLNTSHTDNGWPRSNDNQSWQNEPPIASHRTGPGFSEEHRTLLTNDAFFRESGELKASTSQLNAQSLSFQARE